MKERRNIARFQVRFESKNWDIYLGYVSGLNAEILQEKKFFRKIFRHFEKCGEDKLDVMKRRRIFLILKNSSKKNSTSIPSFSENYVLHEHTPNLKPTNWKITSIHVNVDDVCNLPKFSQKKYFKRMHKKVTKLQTQASSDSPSSPLITKSIQEFSTNFGSSTEKI